RAGPRMSLAFRHGLTPHELNRDKKLVGVVALGDVATETREDGLKSATLETVSETSTPAH
ncbi:MAG TPA: hypothetical protein VEY30_04400, partial [Myxococcaceae bacterium]|nr:hypothetical protein [Myxococcaceae bacterium]